ncbi:MAG: ribonuclease Z [Bacteroidia bacterium]|jgi:ribonuclease Z|nr:MAG: ribonuclease Z [Bacteroidia bacterium]
MSFRLTILGTSSALPTSDRYPSAHVLNVHERLFLIDCGEGTQMQMRRYRLRFGKINHIFITHLHGDHLFGLYPLISSLNLMGRKLPLHIFAPAPFEDLVARHLDDFDITLGYELVIHTLMGSTPKLIFSDRWMEVTSLPLKHRVTAYGFLFREKQAERKLIGEKISEYNLSYTEMASLKRGEDIKRDDGTMIMTVDATTAPPSPASYAYCSDTGYFKKLSSYVSGVDLLYHEATFSNEHASLAKQTGHSTSVQAATVARDAGAGRLVIGHFSSRYKSPGTLEDEAREIFPATEAAREGNSYEI